MSSSNAFKRKIFAVLPSLCASAGLALMVTNFPVQASSHREAPFIAGHPKDDATDLYMFRSYEPNREDFVTFVADYYPGQDPAGGPNFYELDQNALYDINIDNNGDSVPDVKFRFQFTNKRKDIPLTVGGVSNPIPIVQAGSISGINPPTQNTFEQYTVSVIRRDQVAHLISNASNGSTVFDKPIDNIGTKTLNNYPAYAQQFLYNVNIPGCTAAPARLFVGQRKDPFVVNLGGIFDLINIAFPATEFAADAERLGKDTLAKKNVTSLILEVPIACVTTTTDPVIGAYTTASVRSGPLALATAGSDTQVTGSYVQISRLGAPLVNEVVIGLKDKDLFNSSVPRNDGQFAKYVTNPTLPALIQKLFPSVKAPTNFPRTDLVAAFLTGLPGLNKPASVKPSEMLRLNTSIAPTPKAQQNRLGVIGGDNAGFPNGRRPGDDVVDIELRVAIGLLCKVPGLNTAIGCKATDAPSGTVHLTDGAFVDSSFYDDAFPYIRNPLPGSSF